MDVAVKFAHFYAKDWMREDMIKEIGFMKSLGKHPNLLVMVGYVKSIENPVICTEFCVNGSLLDVLKKHKLHFMVAFIL
jgi:serine/threonine protein kinase